jgi:hypothetical protein
MVSWVHTRGGVGEGEGRRIHVFVQLNRITADHIIVFTKSFSLKMFSTFSLNPAPQIFSIVSSEIISKIQIVLKKSPLKCFLNFL